MALNSAAPKRVSYSKARHLSGLLGGAALILLGLRQHRQGRLALSLLGSGLMLNSVTDGRYLSALVERLGINGNGTTQPSTIHHIATHGLTIERTITVQRPPEVLYQFWRDFANLPRFMHHLRSVTVLDDTHSHWVVDAPAGLAVEWDATILREIENELIAWCSLENADVSNTGLVYFERLPTGRGTRVKVVLRYEPPAGKLGAVFAKLFGHDPDQQVREDLRRFKQLMEAGEIPTTEEQPTGHHLPLPL
jgi:uncharacterized membrane protein